MRSSDLTIFLRTYHTEGLNGDRAVVKTPYKIYKVVLSGTKREKILREFDPYNNFHCAIGPDEYKDAQKYANELSDLTGVNVVYEDYVAKTTTTVVWEKKT